jgi:hypothetical protein
MSTTTETKYASYKGRTYRLLWSGKTKYGKKAKLGFIGGSNEFWADLSMVTINVNPPQSKGQNGDIYRDRKGNEMVRGCSACRSLGYMCKQCEFDEYDN